MSSRAFAVAVSLLAFTGTTLPAPAWAAMISTQESLQATSRQADLAKVDSFLHRDQVRDSLIAHGVTPEDAAARVAVLTDAEVQRLASLIDAEPAGELLEVIGVAFVIILILELVGVIDIFKKV